MTVSCTVTVTLESLSVNAIQQAALEGAREAGRKLFLALLGLVEKTLPKERACECGEGRLESRGRVQRELMTVVGDIVFNRQKLRCLGCGKEKYPLDEALGIRGRRLVAPGLRERALWLATEMSYEKASEGAQKLCGIAVSEGTVKNLVWEQGQNIPSGEGKGRVFVQVDGTGINDRVEILDKRTYATTEDISAFREHFVLEAQKYGVFKSKEVIFVSDGANWCRQLKEEYFPEAIYVLDFWHLAKNIKVCLGAERKELVGQLLALAGRGAAGELLGRLWKLLRYNRDPHDESQTS